MNETRAIPKVLQCLALVWALLGIFSLLGLLRLNLDVGVYVLDVGILGLAFAPGLILGWPWVPSIIRWLTWFAIVSLFLVTVGAATAGGLEGWLAAFVCLLIMCVLLEQIHVLKLPEVRRYYDPYGRVE